MGIVLENRRRSEPTRRQIIDAVVQYEEEEGLPVNLIKMTRGIANQISMHRGLPVTLYGIRVEVDEDLPPRTVKLCHERTNDE